MTPAANRRRGFTLIELMVTIAIVAVLLKMAVPSYQGYLIRSSREAAKADLIELAALQEKVFLNSNAFTDDVSSAYTGTSSGGLGLTGGKTRDERYTVTVTVSGATFTLTATPVADSRQAEDGNLTINAMGKRTWGTRSW